MRQAGRLAAGLGLVLSFWAGAAAAQQNVVLPPDPLLAGACGQPGALTVRLRDPVDVVPAADVDLRLERSEPRYVEFALAAPAEVTLTTRSDTGSDTFLAVFDAFGVAVAFDDDGGGELQPLIERLSLPAGRFCAQVRLYGWEVGNPHAALMLSVAVPGTAPPPPQPPVAGGPCMDPALLAEAVGPVGPGFGAIDQVGTVGRESRRDWPLTVAAPLTLMLEATSVEFDTVLSLHDLGGALIAENDDRPQGGTDSEIIQTLQPGAYCISIRGFGGGGGAVRLALAEPGADGAMPGPALALPCGDPARTRPFAPPLAPGFGSLSQTGAVPFDGVEDWTVDLAGAMTLRLGAASGALDTMLELFDADGASLAFNDDAPGQGTDSEIVMALPEGAYCARVSGFGGAGGPYVLTLADDGDAAAGMAAAPDLQTPDPDGAEVTRLGLVGDTVEAAVASAAPVAWFGFDLDEDGPIQLRALSLGGPFGLSLHDADGALLAEASADGGFDIGVIEADLDAGRYLAAIAWQRPGEEALRQLVVSRR